MDSIYKIIEKKKRVLSEEIDSPLEALSIRCLENWDNLSHREHVLNNGAHGIPGCLLTYLVTESGSKMSCGIEPGALGLIESAGDRESIIQTASIIGSSKVKLSMAYMSDDGNGPCISAFYPIIGDNGLVAYVAADFRLSDLALKCEPVFPVNSKQFRGDPSIRGTLFMQSRVDSQMDLNMDESLHCVDVLMREHGIFQARIHFSASRVTLWAYDDPYNYYLHAVDEIINPEVCFAYPRQEYPADARMKPEQISKALKMLQSLRSADETVYLRVASLNIMNGMVEATFSCDGSHYMYIDEFIEKGVGYWFGCNSNNER